MTYSTDQENEVSKIVIYLWIQIEGEDFNSNEVFNLAGCTMKYGPLNRPIIAHVVTERCVEKGEVTLQLNYFFQVQKFFTPNFGKISAQPHTSDYSYSSWIKKTMATTVDDLWVTALF